MMAQNPIPPTIGKIAHRQVVLNRIAGLRDFVRIRFAGDDDAVSALVKAYVSYARASKDGLVSGCDIHYDDTQPPTVLPSSYRFTNGNTKCGSCSTGRAHGLSHWDYDYLGNQINGPTRIETVTGWPDVVQKLRQLHVDAAALRLYGSDFTCDVSVVNGKRQLLDRIVCLTLPANQVVHAPYEIDNWTPDGGHEHLTIHSTQQLQLEELNISGKQLHCLLQPNIGADQRYTWTPCCFVLRARADTVWRESPHKYDKAIIAALEVLYRHSCKQWTITDMDRVDTVIHIVLGICARKFDLTKLDHAAQLCLQEAIEASSDDELEDEIRDGIQDLKSNLASEHKDK